jgi:hypothetical protein
VDDPIGRWLRPSRRRERKDYPDRVVGTRVRSEPLSRQRRRWIAGDFKLGEHRTRAGARRAARRAGVDPPLLLVTIPDQRS